MTHPFNVGDLVQSVSGKVALVLAILEDDDPDRHGDANLMDVLWLSTCSPGFFCPASFFQHVQEENKK